MATRKTSTTVYVDEDVLERLRAVSLRDRVPMAVLIRDAIAKLLEVLRG